MAKSALKFESTSTVGHSRNDATAFSTELNLQKWQGNLKKSVLELLNAKPARGYIELLDDDANWEESKTVGLALRSQFKHLVVMGMGGSSLGGEFLCSLSANAQDLTFITNNHPSDFHKSLTDKSILGGGHYLLISKSGSTVEVMEYLSLLLPVLKKNGRDLKGAVTVLTEFRSNNPLYNWAKENGITTIEHKQNVGGRFSVLSAVGLIPAVFAGLDVMKIREGARAILKNPELLESVTQFLGAGIAAGGKTQVFWMYPLRWKLFLDWLEQLWAESLGQRVATGAQLCAGFPWTVRGTRGQHSVLQQMMESDGRLQTLFFVENDSALSPSDANGPVKNPIAPFEYIADKSAAEIYAIQAESTQKALREVGVPVGTLTWNYSDSSESIAGSLLFLFECSIGVFGRWMGVDVYGQPGVETGKKIAKKTLESR
jgi:glucose-6-phosphate isomerase